MDEDTLVRDGTRSYTVRLDMFEGPLDLLLHLIRKNEINVFDIPIALITEQYLEYLKMMKELDLDIAGDYLLMASTLLQIKSKMLLPVSSEEEEEGGEDPRAELVRRLLEYQRYKDAANELERRPMKDRDFFVRSVPEDATEPQEERFEVNLLAGRLSQQRCRELTAISWLDFADQLAVSFWRRLLFAFRGRSMYRDFRVQIAALKEEQHGTLD